MKNFFRRNFLLLVITFLTASVSYADNSVDPTPQLQQAINNYLQTYSTQNGFSAVSLSVSSPTITSPITVNAGCIDMTNDLLNCSTPSGNYLVNNINLYEIGSITKSFVSTILLQIEATPGSHFNINQKVSQYLPTPEGWGPAADEITIKQLLNMTSGVPEFNDFNNPFWTAFAKNPYYDFNSNQLVRYVQNQYLMFYPGTSWYYSNTNYILAGQLVEKLTGHSLQYEINTRIIQPLGLTNTFYVPDDYPQNTFAIDRRMAHGYIEDSDFAPYFPMGTDATYFSTSSARGAGSIISNTSDIAQWVKALYTSNALLPPTQRAELESLVSQNTGQPITMPTKDDPGYGLGIGGDPGPGNEIVFDYIGGMPGYLFAYTYFPKENITISIATNSINLPNAYQMYAVINQAYGILMNAAPATVQAPKQFYK